MNISDEELMAFVDGELDAERAERLRREIESNPVLARRVSAQTRLRQVLNSAFEPTLQDAVPDRLTKLIDQPAATRGRVTPTRWQTNRISWLGGLALAAGVVLGIAVGPTLLYLRGGGEDIVTRGGQLKAGGVLEQALTNKVAADADASDRVRLGISFKARSGEFCRTFVAGRSDRSVAGLACRDRGEWRIDALQAIATASDQPDGYRQASSAIPPVILQAAQAVMAGEALDAAGEEMARARNWGAAGRQ